MRTAAAWSFPCGGCFLWAGGGPYELRLPRLPVSAAGGRVAAPSIRCALLAYRWPRPQQLLAASAAGGARRRCSRLRCCSNPPLRRFTNFRIKQKLQCHYSTGVLGGRGWIRTTEAEKQQIYSLSPLATREHAHIHFCASVRRTTCLF